MTISNRSGTLLAIPGVMLVVAFFMPWIDVLGLADASGFDLATADELSSRRFLLWLVPLTGAALALTSLGQSPSSRNAGLAAGVVVVGPTLYYLGKGMLFGTSWGLWMVIIGAGWLIALAASRKSEQMILPGLLIAAGFFLPWTTNAGTDFASWGLTGFDIARAPSLPLDLGLPNPAFAWLVPLAAAAAGIAALGKSAASRAVGLIAGVLVIGWMAYFVGRSFSFFTGWGLWLTVGAGFAALAMSVRRA